MLQFIINLRHPNPPLTALPTHSLPLYLKQFRKVLLIDHHSCFSSRFRQCLLYFPTCQRARDKSGEFISLTNWSITISCVHRVLGQFFIAAAASHWPTASRFCLLYRDLSVKHVSRNLSALAFALLPALSFACNWTGAVPCKTLLRFVAKWCKCAVSTNDCSTTRQSFPFPTCSKRPLGY